MFYDLLHQVFPQIDCFLLQYFHNKGNGPHEEPNDCVSDPNVSSGLLFPVHHDIGLHHGKVEGVFLSVSVVESGVSVHRLSDVHVGSRGDSELVFLVYFCQFFVFGWLLSFLV